MTNILDLLQQLLNSGGLFSPATVIWNGCMAVLTGFIPVGPDNFAPDAYSYVLTGILPITLSMGITLANLFFMIGFFRESADLRKNFTWEILIYALMKVVLVNVLLANGIIIMKEFFGVASYLSANVMLSDVPDIAPPTTDIGAMLLYWMLGLIYLIVAIVCLFLIFQTIGSRYLNLYLMICTYPIALATIPGGQGIDRTASSWIRTFIAKAFEVVIISLAIVLSGKIMDGVNFFTGVNTADSEMLSVITNLFHMAFMAASVKGAEGFLQKAFGL